MSDPRSRPDTPPPEAAKFPPAEYMQRSDGLLYRMVPAWLEIRRVTEWVDRRELDTALNVPAGTVNSYCQGPIVLPDRTNLSLPPTKELVDAIYRAADENPPDVIAKMQVRPTGSPQLVIDGVSHIGVQVEKEPAGF